MKKYATAVQFCAVLKQFIKRKDNMHTNKKKAFTLSELLMSVLVISIVMVAMAPVITKRVSDNISVGDVKTEGVLYTLAVGGGSSCNMAAINWGSGDWSSSEDVIRQQNCEFIVPDDVYNVNVMVVGAGGAGGNARAGETETITKVFTQDEELEFEDDKFIHNLRILYASGGGGGGSAGWAGAKGNKPTSQEDCDDFNAKFLVLEENGEGICVAKRNVGDILENDPLNNASALGIEVVTAGSASGGGGSCSGTSANGCCWKGVTSNTCEASKTFSGGSTTYSGCNRTVCEQKAAEVACAVYNPDGKTKGFWRLPTYNELQLMKGVIDAETSSAYLYQKYLGANGMDLCNSSTGYGSIRCAYSNTNCLRDTSTTTTCYPYYIWSLTPYTTEGRHYSAYLSSSRLYATNSVDTYAASSRCVLDTLGDGTLYTAKSGGGGGASALLKDFDELKNRIIGSYSYSNSSITNAPYSRKGRLEIKVGRGGIGGTSTTPATDGEDTTFEYYTLDTDDNWFRSQVSYRVAGGKAANTPSLSDNSDGGLLNNSCYRKGRYENSGDNPNNSVSTTAEWEEMTCSGFGPAGGNGETKSTLELNIAPQGGIGGGSLYNLGSYGIGGIGGSLGLIDGGTITAEDSYGAGGGGGSVRLEDDGTVTIGNGGDGKQGVVVIQYNTIEMGNAGGGGGGGGMVIARNVRTAPGCEWTIFLQDPNPNTVSTSGTQINSFAEAFGWGDCPAYRISAHTGSPGQTWDGDTTERDPNGLICRIRPYTVGCPGVPFPDYKHAGVGGAGGSGEVTGLPESQYTITDGLRGENHYSRLNCSGEGDGEFCMGVGGGSGGVSGSGAIGGCGGSYDTDTTGSIENDNWGCIKQEFGRGANGHKAPFIRPGDITAGDYGQAGSGGGGGGWSVFNENGAVIAGQGAQGQAGFVYIWWTKVE